MYNVAHFLTIEADQALEASAVKLDWARSGGSRPLDSQELSRIRSGSFSSCGSSGSTRGWSRHAGIDARQARPI